MDSTWKAQSPGWKPGPMIEKSDGKPQNSIPSERRIAAALRNGGTDGAGELWDGRPQPEGGS
jgi:hypothetical protein